ncbi:DUF3006 domain-containing protein [Thermotalea metallivorans]|uniref:DUF3006 domain-containing protein n=1 Tax=Thermotalea metallivorans TaxID=520762 RepID=A0A140L6Z3_9FIRM|nr:DUF3006 domain-containing protein [Thermotalea metallivorans]KXG76318.1 hypothetical protein AN619_12760 [Thermotalea metallivorans]
MFVLDRIEGEWAVIEGDKGMFQLPKTLLPQDAREGDILEIHIIIDGEQGKARKERLEERAKGLWEE